MTFLVRDLALGSLLQSFQDFFSSEIANQKREWNVVSTVSRFGPLLCQVVEEVGYLFSNLFRASLVTKIRRPRKLGASLRLICIGTLIA